MKVVLLQEVKGVGKKEDILNVSDGYARNFLFPKGLAVEASTGKLREIADKKSSEKNRKDKELQDAKILADKLNKVEIQIKTKAGENGKLFGSITNKDIADALKIQQRIDIDKKKIALSDAIKAVGSYTVEVKVYPEVSAKVAVKIIVE